MISTRDRLLDAALAAFATKGVDGTPITDLEADAGLAPGSGGFYRYFKTKDEVLAAAVEREMARLDAEEETVDATDTGAHDEPLPARLATTLRTLAAHNRLIAIVSRERHRIPALARSLEDRVARSGSGPDGDSSLSAVTVSALVGYHLAREYFGRPPGGLEPEDFAEVLAGVVSAASVPA